MFPGMTKESVVVQKYGGTSVGSVERIQKIAKRVAEQHREGFTKIAVVVSAMAGETNRVVELVHQVNPRASATHYDLAVATGEQVSSALMAAALEAEGVGAQAFLPYQIGLLTDGLHAQARVRSIETEKIEACWRDGKIPVVPGFQGINEENEVTTLGRGGSDISAVALAVVLKAHFCEINTDVDGVYTADPRVVKTARLVEVLDYETALEMAALGSKVLHSRCVELGAKYQMPIVVRNSHGGDEGEERKTVIMNYSAQSALEAPVVSAVSLDTNVAKISLTGMSKHTRAISGVFEAVAKAGINVDIIVQNLLANKTTMRVGFTILENDLSRALEVIESLRQKEEYKGMHASSRTDLAKVSVVGLAMRSYAGVASRVFETLAQKGIDILMISTSEIKISCVVPQDMGKLAAQALHEAFLEQ